METATTCPGCGVVLPHRPGPMHDYLDTSAECWALYGDMLAREYQDPAYYWAHELTVDAYAVQHPGDPGRPEKQSVWVHLATLHLQLDQERHPRSIPALRRRLVDLDELEWLEPPAALGELTIAHLVPARTADEHIVRVQQWAKSAWNAWSEHHEAVRAWVDRAQIPG